MSLSNIPKHLREILTSQNLLIISTLFTIFSTFFFYYKKRNMSIAKERLEKVYQPILKIIETELYKYSNKTFFLMKINEMKQIIDDNRFLAGNDLYSIFYKFINCSEKKKKKKLFNMFSNQFLYTYNKLCRDIGVPVISQKYRKDNKLFDTIGKIQYRINAISQVVIGMCLPFAIFIILVNLML